jgi:hypothetical protein
VNWQEVSVAVIVAGAAWFVARRVFGSPRPSGASSFVPLGRLRRGSKDQCH